MKRTVLLPKKKFAFTGKTKVSRVKGAEMSVAAAHANPLDAKPVSAGGTSAVAGASMLAAATTEESDHQQRTTISTSTILGSSVNSGSLAPQPSQSSTSKSSPSPQDIALVKQGHGLMGLRDQVVVLAPTGHDFVLIDLVGCSVYLMGHMPALRMMGLRDTLVVAGPVTGDINRGIPSCIRMLRV